MERHQGNLPALFTRELKGTFRTAVLVEVFRLAAVWSRTDVAVLHGLESNHESSLQTPQEA